MDINSLGMKSGNASRSDGSSGGVASQIEILKADFSDLAGKVADAAKARAAQINDTATDKADELRDTIRQKPMQAALISAGMGFLLGVLLTR